MNKDTRRSCTLTIVISLAFAVLVGAGPVAQNGTRENAAAAAAQAAIAAVTFRQGDLAGFTRARTNFTSDGWGAFLKHMEGYLDANGTPTFTSSFAPTGKGKLLDEKDGVVHLRVPGTLVQSNQIGKTTYRAALEVYAETNPVRLVRVEQITCLGASTACQ